MKYLKIKTVKKIRELFEKNFILNKSLEKITRSEMFEFGTSDEFLKIYDLLALEIGKKMKWSLKKTIYQSTPTFRVFRPNMHGTSFHNDFSYGHGMQSFTVWIPLTDINKDNTFRMINSKFTKKNRNIISKIAIDYNEKLEKKIFNNSFPVMPKKNEVAIFSSNEIHGSPKNNSKSTRISFDFRLTQKDDITSTKELSSYQLLSSKKNRKKIDLKIKMGRTLKYICGGKSIPTSAQHFIIDKIASEFKINLVGQEAEMERFGAPFFYNYISNKLKHKKYKTIMIASQSILPHDYLSHSDKRIQIYDALEQRFL